MVGEVGWGCWVRGRERWHFVVCGLYGGLVWGDGEEKGRVFYGKGNRDRS